MLTFDSIDSTSDLSLRETSTHVRQIHSFQELPVVWIVLESDGIIITHSKMNNPEPIDIDKHVYNPLSSSRQTDNPRSFRHCAAENSQGMTFTCHRVYSCTDKGTPITDPLFCQGGSRSKASMEVGELGEKDGAGGGRSLRVEQGERKGKTRIKERSQERKREPRRRIKERS